LVLKAAEITANLRQTHDTFGRAAQISFMVGSFLRFVGGLTDDYFSKANIFFQSFFMRATGLGHGRC
jgi:hypothetical protein